MPDTTWRARRLPRPGFELAWYEAGHGPAVVFLHGGPGDNSLGLRSLAAPLADRWRCVLYDQRGTGESRLPAVEAESLDARLFVEDLEALRAALGVEQVALVGHSWGANLALLYAGLHPARVARLALLGLGPLDAEASAVARANLMRGLSAEARQAVADLVQRRSAALAAGDRAAYLAVAEQHMRFTLTAAFYSPETAAGHVEEHLAEMGDLYHVARVNGLVNDSYAPLRAEAYARLSGLRCPVLCVYGYQDFEPITQAYALRARMPQTEVCFINQCGHVPWIEQPEACLRALRRFLSSDGQES